MALMVPGPAASVLSGKLGGVVFSRNKGGAYARSYAIPTVVTSDRALLVKFTLAYVSQSWSALSAANRLAWDQYALARPTSNRIGQQILLSGQAWHNACNSRLVLANESPITAPPVLPTPAATQVHSPEVDVNGEAASITFLSHPETSNIKAVIYGAVVTSGARNYVRNQYTHIATTDTDPSGAEDIGTELVAALGTIQEGLTYHFKVQWVDIRTGLISAAVFVRTVAVDTTA